MRRAFALLLAASLAAPSPSAAAVFRAAPAPRLTAPAVKLAPAARPGALALPASVLVPVAVAPLSVPSLSPAVAPMALPALAGQSPAVPAIHDGAMETAGPVLAAMFDGAVVRGAAAQDGPRPVIVEASAARPELVLREARVPEPSAARRVLARAARAARLTAPVAAPLAGLPAAAALLPAALAAAPVVAAAGAAAYVAGKVAEMRGAAAKASGVRIAAWAAAAGAAAAAVSVVSAPVAAVTVAVAGLALAFSTSEPLRDAARDLLARLPAVSGAIAPAERSAEKPMFRVEKRRDGSRRVWIEPARFGKLMLVSATIEKGLGEQGIHGGRTDMLDFAGYFRKSGGVVELMRRNLSVRAAPGSQFERAVQDGTPDVPAAKLAILDTDKATGAVAVSADELFLQDLFNLKAELEQKYDGEYVVDEDVSGVTKAKAYPRNVELGATQVYVRREHRGGEVPATRLPDARRLPLSLRLSLSELPPAGYRPRAADSRVGHFATVYEDWTEHRKQKSTKALINRWRLEKTDPKAALSPVKQPVVFWLDDSVPKQYRGAVRQGVLKWNEAFEKIGLLGALEVREASEDPSFDRSDVRRSVIRWHVDRDERYSIGQARVDPVTGEFYQATIAMDANVPRSVLNGNMEDLSEAEEETEDEAERGPHQHGPRCGHGAALRREAGMSMAAIEARGGMTDEERERYVQEAIVDLTLHEVGHTLGLRHNFLGKVWKERSELQQAPISASVMDYLPVNVAEAGAKQGPFWNTELGPYDFWAIEYAYKPLAPEKEAAELAKIASRSGEPGLAYATDEDLADYDPASTPHYIGKDPLAFAKARFSVSREIWASLEARKAGAADDTAGVYRSFVQSWKGYQYAARLSVSVLGGLLYRRGAGPSHLPLTPETGDRRRDALKLLDEAVFSDAPFGATAELRRRLNAGRGPTVDNPKPDLDWLAYDYLVLELRQDALKRVLDPELMVRLAEGVKMAAPGDKPLTPRDLIEGLTDIVWREAIKPAPRGKLTISPDRRRLQEAHLNLLIKLGFRSAKDEIPEVSALARAHLARLVEKIDAKTSSKRWDDASRDHLEQASLKITAASDYYQP